MTDVRPVLGAIDRLYAAVLAPADWPAAVESIGGQGLHALTATEREPVSRLLPVVAATILLIASSAAPAIAQTRFDLPSSCRDTDRSATIGSLPDHSRRLFEVPPGGTPQPWQRVPDFDRLDDVVAVVTAIGTYCAEQRHLTCVRLCPVPAPPGAFDQRRIPEGQRRDWRITLWRRCAESVGAP